MNITLSDLQELGVTAQTVEQHLTALNSQLAQLNSDHDAQVAVFNQKIATWNEFHQALTQTQPQG